MILSLWNEGEKPALVFSGVFFFLIFVNVLYCCNHYLHTPRLIPIGVIPYDSNWMHCHSTPTSPPSFYCSLCMNVPLGNTRGLERHRPEMRGVTTRCLSGSIFTKYSILIRFLFDTRWPCL